MGDGEVALECGGSAAALSFFTKRKRWQSHRTPKPPPLFFVAGRFGRWRGRGIGLAIETIAAAAATAATTRLWRNRRGSQRLLIGASLQLLLIDQPHPLRFGG